MKTVNTILCMASLVGLTATASAQVFKFDISADPNAVPPQSIPDGDVNGNTYLGTVSGFASGYTISTNSFKVLLNIQGEEGFPAANSDLYATLSKVKADGTTEKWAVLLNRVGKPLNFGVGYTDNGFNVRLYDGVESGKTFYDIHWYQDQTGGPITGDGGNSGALTGIWKPDGRNVDPITGAFAYGGGDPARSKTLAEFQGLNPNGDWSLFIADVASGGSAKLVSWGLDFNPIPEPQEYALAIGVGLLGFAIYRRRSLKTA